MKRIEIYVNNSDKLVVELYNNEQNYNDKKVFKGRDGYALIDRMCNGKIRQVSNLNSNDITLHYNNYYVDIFDYEQVLSKLGTNPIKKDLNIFYNTKNIKNIKKNKVQRKNKYVKKKIITTTLGLIVLSSVAAINIDNVGAKNKETKNPPLKIEKITDKEIDNNVNDLVELKENSQLEEKTESNEILVSISYDDRSNTEKASITKNYYGDLIEKYSKQYGLDSKIVTAIATQERGVHSTVKDSGGATGLMQIQNGAWVGNKLTAFNYNTNQAETIIVNEDMLSDINYNIKVGCMIFQNNMREMKNNMLAAIQCYNLGSTNMRKILNAYSKDTGRSIDTILNDVNDNGWLEYRDILGIGDPEYIENVLSWVGDKVTINNVQSNGNVVNLSICNENQTKNMSIN